jgi:hypothetical protein
VSHFSRFFFCNLNRSVVEEARSPSVNHRFEWKVSQFVKLDELSLVALSVFPDEAEN